MDTYVSLNELYEMYELTGTKPPDWLSRVLGNLEDDEELRRWAIEAGIPSLFAVAPPDDTRLDALSEGGGIYICGSQGAGKTWLACRMAKAWMQHGRGSVRFVTSVRLLAEISDTYGSRGASETQVLDTYAGYSLLVVDDLGKEVPSKWTLSRLFELFNMRYADRRATVVTTQFSPDALARRMAESGDRETAMAIVSRFREKYRSVNLGNVDRRARKQ